jgi:hypothetical protein
MKISTQDIDNSKKQKVFHPFNIVLTIEDESDLENLAVRLNMNYNTANKYASYDGYHAKDNDAEWYTIDTLLKTRPYMK